MKHMSPPIEWDARYRRPGAQQGNREQEIISFVIRTVSACCFWWNRIPISN